jgi:O-antigen ligase
VCVLIGASLATAILGGHVGPYAAGAGWPGLFELAALAVGLGVAWTAMRGATTLHRRAMLASSVSLAAIALGGGVSLALRDDVRASSSGTASLTAGRPASGLLHGRGHEWGAALETWMEHPLLGAGAGAYAQASVSHQGADASLFAHDLPLELAAELGILGALLALALYVTPVSLILRASPSPGLWLLAPTVLVFLASNLVDWTWHLTGLAAVWALACGALQGERRG